MWHFELVKVKPNYASIRPGSARWSVPLTANGFDWLVQYTNSSCSRAYCYTELAIWSLATAVTLSTHEGMTRLSRSGWLG